MWQAIAAAIGLVDNVNKGNQGQYAAQQAAAADSIQFSEAKDMALYSSLKSTQVLIGAAALVGLIILAVIVYVLIKK